MSKSVLAVCFVLSLTTLAVQAQRDSSRNDFISAESWFLYEEYGEAEALYQKLLKQDPSNYNLKYKIGVCLLEDPYRISQSIPYLEEASEHISSTYKEGSFKERSAPPDALYHLGRAYLVNEKLDQAIEQFTAFLEIMDSELYDVELVQAQIDACNNAKRLMSMPVDIDLNPVSQEVNTRYPETHPVISGDEKRMAFVTEQPFFDEALYIELVDSAWTLPMSITSMLGFDEDIYPVAMNYDGTEMLLYYDDQYIGNLYHSEFEDGFWQPATKMNSHISTKYWESHGCFSKDGQTLYFTSNRKGTLGGLDIWKSQRQEDGSWGEPVNLGEPVNTRYNEESPYLTEDGKTLYFSSYGHYNMGGYDIFYATQNPDSTWAEPVNLGYPINTTGDDMHFQPVRNGFGGYMSRLEENSQGRLDLYFIDIYSDNNPRVYLVTGFVRTQSDSSDLTKLELFVIDPETGDTVAYQVPIESDGAFSLNLLQGEYLLHFGGEGYEPQIRPLSITPSSNKVNIELGGVELALIEILPVIFEDDESLIFIDESTYSGPAGVPLAIPLGLLHADSLLVAHEQDSSILKQDTLVFVGATAADSLQGDTLKLEIQVVPELGENSIHLEMIDKEGNLHLRTLRVIGTVPVPVTAERIVREVEPEPEPQAAMPQEEPEVDSVPEVEISEPFPADEGYLDEDGEGTKKRAWLWILLGGGLLFLLIFLWRRRKDKEE